MNIGTASGANGEHPRPSVRRGRLTRRPSVVGSALRDVHQLRAQRRSAEHAVAEFGKQNGVAIEPWTAKQKTGELRSSVRQIVASDLQGDGLFLVRRGERGHDLGMNGHG